MHFPALIPNTMLLSQAAGSFMLQGYRLFAHARHLLWRFLHHAADLDVGFDARWWALRGSPDPPGKPALIPGPEMQSTPPGVSPDPRVLISSSRMRSCQYNNHRERKPFLPPACRINAAHLQHRTRPGQTAIKTPAPHRRRGGRARTADL